MQTPEDDFYEVTGLHIYCKPFGLLSYSEKFDQSVNRCQFEDSVGDIAYPYQSVDDGLSSLVVPASFFQAEQES